MICISSFNKTIRKPIQCDYCKLTYCMQCIKRYILSRAEDAHCMNCKTGWTMDFLFVNFPLSFIHDDYELSRAKIKLIQQKILLPETQLLINRRKCLHTMSKKHRKYMDEVYQMNYLLGQVTFQSTIHVNLTTAVKTVQDAMEAFLIAKANYDDLTFQTINENNSISYISKIKEEVSIISHCIKDGCRGFISNRGKCGLCNLIVCTKCLKEKMDSHECKEEDIASVNLLRKDSRLCPKCKVLIHRFEGCPQMWCTQCHTGFDWNTGEILKKLHNPHLTEWLMNNNNNNTNQPIQDNNNNPCGLPAIDLMDIRNKIALSKDQSYVRTIYDKAQHFHNFEIPNLGQNFERRYEELRETYLMKIISEETWVNEIKSIRKREMRNNELIQILELFFDASMDILRQLQQNKINWMIAHKGLNDLCEMVNNKLSIIEKRLKISCMKYRV